MRQIGMQLLPEVFHKFPDSIPHISHQRKTGILHVNWKLYLRRQAAWVATGLLALVLKVVIPKPRAFTSGSESLPRAKNYFAGTCFSAWSKSAIKSSVSSMPTEYRISASGMPLAARSSRVDSTWLVVAGGPAMVSTAPRF